MKTYKYKQTKRKINGIKHTVIIPEKHTVIQALVLETIDLNAWDDYANITCYHTTCLILEKNSKDWKTIYNGLTESFKIDNNKMYSHGYFLVLFELETEKFKQKYYKKEKIKLLKHNIKKYTSELKELTR